MRPASCAEFERWLDDGRAPRGLDGGPLAHASGCARCAALLEADDGLEGWLAPPASRASNGFSDRVMERIATLQPSGFASGSTEAPTMPWWLDALRQPATVLAAVCLGLVAWRFDRLAAAAPVAVAWLSGGVQSAFGSVAGATGQALPAALGGGSALVVTAVALGLLPPVLMASFAAGRWAERLTVR